MPAAPRTVAIVDDDAELLKGLERVLNAHGLGTKAFSSAEAFLATNSGMRIDCVLLDVHLGGMSGIALRRALSASGGRVGVRLPGPVRPPRLSPNGRGEETAADV